MANITADGGIERFLDFDNRGGAGEVKRLPLKNLPIIDISPIVRDAALADQQGVGREIRDACVNIGFFYLSGHGIPAEELDELIVWGHRFWALPLEERLKLQKSAESKGLGFVPSGGTDPGADTRTAYSIDWGDGVTQNLSVAEWSAASGGFNHN